MLMNMEPLTEEQMSAKTAGFEENVSQCHFVHQQFHINWSGIEPGKPAPNHLSYIMAQDHNDNLKYQVQEIRSPTILIDILHEI
jgi:hypothetical protein